MTTTVDREQRRSSSELALAAEAEALQGTGTAPRHRPTPSPRMAIGALLLGNTLLRTGVVAVALAVQFLLVDLSMGRPDGRVVGAIGAAQALSEVVFSPFLARLADRLGRSRLLIAAPLFGLCGVLLLLLATSNPQIALARLLEGIAAAAFVPTALGTIAAATAANAAARARASTAFEGTTLLGYGLGYALGGLTYHLVGRNCFLLLGSLYLAAAVVTVMLLPKIPPLPVSSVREVLNAIVGPGPIRAFIPAWLAVNALVGGVLANLPAQLKRPENRALQVVDDNQHLWHQLDGGAVTGVLVALIALLVGGLVAWTPLLHRLGPATTMRRATVGAGVVCLSFLAINHAPLTMGITVPLAIFGAIGVLIQSGFGPAAVNYLADCSETLAADRSSLMAFYTVTLAGGGAVGAVLGGFATNWLHLDGLVVIGIVLIVIAAVSLRRVKPTSL